MKKLFTISEFARLRNININSLRYYEKIGVLKPVHVDEQTGYRYYSPDQLPILDVILLCLDFGIPLKELKSYIDNDEFIKNNDLFEAGRQIAEERVRHAQTELNKIEYTLQFLNVNRQYSEQTGLYEREIPERRIITTEYTGDLLDIKKIETTSAVLYEYAQGKQLAPVFPAGLIVETDNRRMTTKIFFEVMAKEKSDASIESISAGRYGYFRRRSCNGNRSMLVHLDYVDSFLEIEEYIALCQTRTYYSKNRKNYSNGIFYGY